MESPQPIGDDAAEAVRWQKLGELFEAAMDLAPEDQKAYLDQACQADAALREELELMLSGSFQQRFSSAIGNIAEDMANDSDSDPLLNTRLGPYRITQVLGRGGMGAVYKAVREDDQYRKQVAIKVIPKLLAGREAIARFRSERQILANLEHPNIARLLDGGASDGIPYLVMEYVEGVPVTHYVKDRNLPLTGRLALLQSVCAAVQYAHGNLVVHRDLKPANILVTADGTVKLLDFGVAKITDPEAQMTSAYTSALLMTPDYASPEQVRGEPVTTATDVYSLGVVLYEVLTGERPFKVTGQTPREMEKAICLTEPIRPSAVETLPARQRRSLSGDLDNIVLMAMHKDAARRYKSAEQLARDIQRHLDGKPVRARPDTLAYRMRKFVTRNLWPVAAGLVFAVGLIIATVFSIRQAHTAQRRFDQLRGFARTVLVDLHAQLNDIPGTARARQALISHVSDYLRKLSADSADDTELAAEIATTYLRIAEIQGATPEALTSLENARTLMQHKIQRSGGRPSDLLTLASIRQRAGNVQAETGKANESQESLLAASAIAQGISAADPAIAAEAMKIRARSAWRVGRAYRVQLRLPEAEKYARESIGLCEELARLGRADRESGDILNGAQLVLGGTLRRQGKFRESLETYSKVLAENQRRVNENPASAGFQRNLARIHQIMGDLYTRVPGRGDDIRKHVRAAIAIAEELAEPDPADKAAQSELGQFLSSGAEAFFELGDWDEGIALLQRALPIFEKLRQREPDSSVNLLYAALVEAELGDSLGRKSKVTPASLQQVRNGYARMKQLVDRDPRERTNWVELFKLQRMLASNLARAGQPIEAISVTKDLLNNAKAVAAGSAETAMLQVEVPRALAHMGEIYKHLGRLEESRKWYGDAVTEWDRWLASGHSNPDMHTEIERARQAVR